MKVEYKYIEIEGRCRRVYPSVDCGPVDVSKLRNKFNFETTELKDAI
jgi:hypothetical protein